MTSTTKKIVGLMATVVVLLGIIVLWHIFHKPKNPLVGTTDQGNAKAVQNVGDFDQFQQDLATRVLDKFGAGSSGSDFSVIVATTAYPLGTLLRPTGSIPADFDDCVPSPVPTPLSAQRLFPSYSMSSDTALAANLGSGALQGLDSAGVSLKQSSSVQYAITDTQIQIMDDKSVDTVTAKGGCGKYISTHPGTRLIRGTVIGKMTFTVKVDNPASVKAQLAKIGGFTVTDNPQASTLDIADAQSAPIVELLSEFGGPTSAASSPTTPKPVEAAVSPARSPASVGVSAHMYVQEDVQDTPASGAKVVQLLQTGWPSAKVEDQVQRIPSQKMPDVAQVRYFNGADAEMAQRCAGILKKLYPNARVVRIGLPSPQGQLEVWLPKVDPNETK
ncbi:MAG: hypothetical protein WBW03_11005 [Silvibacterium sp.]